MAAPTYVEIKPQRSWREFVKKGKWRGIRKFVVPTSDLSVQLIQLRVLPHIVNGFRLFPRYVDVRQKSEEAPDQSLVTLIYQFADNPDAYTKNRARLSIDAYGVEYRKAVEDGDNGRQIESQVQDDGTFWKPSPPNGNVALRPEAKYVIRTALAQSELTQPDEGGLSIMARAYAGIGKTNAGTLDVSGVRMAEIGELHLQAVQIPTLFLFDGDEDIVPVRYQFLYRKGGFKGLTARQYKKVPMFLPVESRLSDPGQDDIVYVLRTDETDTTTEPADAKMQTVSTTRPLGPAEDRTMFEEYDFSFILSLVEW